MRTEVSRWCPERRWPETTFPCLLRLAWSENYEIVCRWRVRRTRTIRRLRLSWHPDKPKKRKCEPSQSRRKSSSLSLTRMPKSWGSWKVSPPISAGTKRLPVFSPASLWAAVELPSVFARARSVWEEASPFLSDRFEFYCKRIKNVTEHVPIHTRKPVPIHTRTRAFGRHLHTLLSTPHRRKRKEDPTVLTNRTHTARHTHTHTHTHTHVLVQKPWGRHLYHNNHRNSLAGSKTGVKMSLHEAPPQKLQRNLHFQFEQHLRPAVPHLLQNFLSWQQFVICQTFLWQIWQRVSTKSKNTGNFTQDGCTALWCDFRALTCTSQGSWSFSDCPATHALVWSLTTNNKFWLEIFPWAIGIWSQRIATWSLCLEQKWRHGKTTDLPFAFALNSAYKDCAFSYLKRTTMKWHILPQHNFVGLLVTASILTHSDPLLFTPDG